MKCKDCKWWKIKSDELGQCQLPPDPELGMPFGSNEGEKCGLFEAKE